MTKSKGHRITAEEWQRDDIEAATAPLQLRENAAVLLVKPEETAENAGKLRRPGECQPIAVYT